MVKVVVAPTPIQVRIFPHLSIPSPFGTPSYLSTPNAAVLEAYPIFGRLALLVPDYERNWIGIVQFSSDLMMHQPDFMVNDLSFSLSEEKVCEMAQFYGIPSDVHLLVPKRQDTILNPPLGY